MLFLGKIRLTNTIVIILIVFCLLFGSTIVSPRPRVILASNSVGGFWKCFRSLLLCTCVAAAVAEVFYVTSHAARQVLRHVVLRGTRNHATYMRYHKTSVQLLRGEELNLLSVIELIAPNVSYALAFRTYWCGASWTKRTFSNAAVDIIWGVSIWLFGHLFLILIKPKVIRGLRYCVALYFGLSSNQSMTQSLSFLVSGRFPCCGAIP